METKKLSRKSKLLISFNALLIVIIYLFISFSNRKDSSIITDIVISLPETSNVQKIKIDTLLIIKEDDKWKINTRYEASNAKIEMLFKILQGIAIKRKTTLDPYQWGKKHIKLSVYNDDKKLLRNYDFIITEEDTYILKDSILYSIYLPNHFLDIGKFFDSNSNYWRNKKILNTSFHTLKKLSIEYTNDESNSFSIVFDSIFYTIKGITKLDSAKLYDYIQAYKNFSVLHYFSNLSSYKDSLKTSYPVGIISVEDTDSTNNDRLVIFPGKKHFYGIIEKTDEAVVLSKEFMRKLLVKKQFFVKE